MILDYFFTDDEITRKDLKKIDSLLKQETFLSGLGGSAAKKTPLVSFPIIADVSTASRYMTSQEIWDLPEPWPFQYFSGLVSDEAARLEYDSGLLENKRVELNELFQRNLDDFVSSCFEKIKIVYMSIM